ncbi:MAG: hypothetical protein ACUZ8H_01525 [Candidatus Anammoxibacter sp.]
MNLTLDILNNPNETFENDAVIINLITKKITWKPMMFSPKLSNDIQYWFNELKKLNS